MSSRVDITDWLGGHPYEYASVAEVFAFVRDLGFSLVNLRCNNGLLNNEYVFFREPAPRSATPGTAVGDGALQPDPDEDDSDR